MNLLSFRVISISMYFLVSVEMKPYMTVFMEHVQTQIHVHVKLDGRVQDAMYVFLYRVVSMDSVMNHSNVFVLTLKCGAETIAIKVKIRHC